MANIVLKVKGLTGVTVDVTISDGQTWNDLIALTQAVEGSPITTTMYGKLTLERGKGKNSSSTPTTTFLVNNIGTGDLIICSPNKTVDKETRQEHKGAIASAKRKGLAAADTGANYYKAANTFNKNRLPNPYAGDDFNAADNENTGALQTGRPWT